MDLDKIIQALEDDISYFDYHNKNMTKKQDEKIQDIKDIIEDLKTFNNLLEEVD